MATILFELFPAQSHHMMAFKTARLLKSAGHRVVFGSVQEMQEITQRYGFEFQFIPFAVVFPLGQYILQKKHGIALPTPKERLEEARKKIKLFNQQISNIKPDMVLIDRHQMIGKSMFYKQLGIPITYICVMPDPSKAENVPPFSSSFIPCDNWFSKKYISFLWFSNRLKGELAIINHRILHSSISDLSVYKALAKEFDINSAKVRIPRNANEIHLQTTPRIVLSATDLDFPRPLKEGVYNIGPLIDLPADETRSTDTRYEAMKSIITKGNTAIIYCSLGMLVDFCTEQKIRLYRKIKKVAMLAPNDFIVICTGDDLDNSNLLPLPPNLFVFKSLPQKDLLKYCTLMINHGGLNSITECIFNEVPVIAYPPSHMADHSCNSARVVYHGLGLRGKVGRDSPKAILKKINHIKNSMEGYKNNIRRMKQKFEEKNNSTEVVTIIDTLLANSMPN